MGKIFPIIKRKTPILDLVERKKEDNPRSENKSIDEKIDELIDECAEEVKDTEESYKEKTGEFYDVEVSETVTRKYIRNTIKGLLGKLDD